MWVSIRHLPFKALLSLDPVNNCHSYHPPLAALEAPEPKRTKSMCNVRFLSDSQTAQFLS